MSFIVDSDPVQTTSMSYKHSGFLFNILFCKVFTLVNSKAVSNAAVSRAAVFQAAVSRAAISRGAISRAAVSHAAVSTDSFTAFPHAVPPTVPPTVSQTVFGTLTKFDDPIEFVTADFDLTDHLTCHAGT